MKKKQPMLKNKRYKSIDGTWAVDVRYTHLDVKKRIAEAKESRKRLRNRVRWYEKEKALWQRIAVCRCEMLSAASADLEESIDQYTVAIKGLEEAAVRK